MADLAAFFDTYFIQPIIQHQGYNLVNTLVFAAILLVLAFFVIYPLLDRLKIKFDSRFMFSLIPYILLGITVRVLEDISLVERSLNPFEFGFYTYTPGVWLFVAAITIAALLVSVFISRRSKFEFYLPFTSIGIVAALPTVILNLLLFQNWISFFVVAVLIFAIVAFVVLVFKKVLKHNLFDNNMNILALAGQVIDGSATFIATQFLNCGEQHPLSEAILNVNGLLFIVVKVLLVIVILYYVDREIKSENLRGFIKIVIAILGFSTGMRGFFTVGAGTCG